MRPQTVRLLPGLVIVTVHYHFVPESEWEFRRIHSHLAGRLLLEWASDFLLA